MPRTSRLPICFEAVLQRPAQPGDEEGWGFVVIPAAVEGKQLRRGRIAVAGTINGQAFQATLDPDGQLGHWLRVDAGLIETSGAKFGEVVALEISPVQPQPEPELPADFRRALENAPAAQEVWDGATTLARLDWIHWMTSAKQAQTRKKRVLDACEMLAAGKKRVCCFDPSGFYSKAFAAPEAAE